MHDEEEEKDVDIMGGTFTDDDTDFPLLDDDLDMTPLKFDESEDDPDDKFH
jgi:hypothetical protein